MASLRLSACRLPSCAAACVGLWCSPPTRTPTSARPQSTCLHGTCCEGCEGTHTPKVGRAPQGRDCLQPESPGTLEACANHSLARTAQHTTPYASQQHGRPAQPGRWRQVQRQARPSVRHAKRCAHSSMHKNNKRRGDHTHTTKAHGQSVRQSEMYVAQFCVNQSITMNDQRTRVVHTQNHKCPAVLAASPSHQPQQQSTRRRQAHAG